MSDRPTEDEFHALLRSEGISVTVASLLETECYECGCPLFVPAARLSEEWWCDNCGLAGT